MLIDQFFKEEKSVTFYAENGMIKILGNRNKGEVLWLHTESEK